MEHASPYALGTPGTRYAGIATRLPDHVAPAHTALVATEATGERPPGRELPLEGAAGIALVIGGIGAAGYDRLRKRTPAGS